MMPSELEKEPIPFPDELEHLAEVTRRLGEALGQADSRVERIDREYREEKRYMVQNRGDIDPAEMFQNELALKDIDRAGALAVSTRDKMARLRDSPYFARIDFQEEGQPPEPVYIGRFAFRHQDELLISDWRSPIASLFYDCQVGPAGYDAPAGRFEGLLTRKRQFKIKAGEMEYALETSDNVQDDVLQRELSHTSDEKMKSIIGTIQKEQNQIIRNEKAGIMIIQGVAGSGKTSIALHRIAYLLYRFKEKLSARNVTILSPNKVFGDYISNVLPELGEEPIFEASLTDVAEIQLRGVAGFEPDRDPLENHEEAWAQRVRFKSTVEFARQLDQFSKTIPQLVFAPTDLTIGQWTAKAQWIQTQYEAYAKHPVKRRLQWIAEDIQERYLTDNYEERAPRVNSILKSLKAMLKIKDSLTLYRLFYQTNGLDHMLVMPAKKTLEWADVFPLLYLHAAFEGLKQSSVIRHLVVDEMQDYTPIQYAVLNLLFPCPKTILGDFGQRINPNHLHTLEDLQRIYQGAELVALNKSYRSTYEIIQFAKRIQRVDTLEAVERHGEAPSVQACASQREQLDRIEAAIAAFEAGGYASLGILTKTTQDAKRLFDLLSPSHSIHLITPESNSFANGVSIASVTMSKGLEFDHVIIPDASREQYRTAYDRSLLYIACTRAMHRLDLLYTGEPSPLIGPEDQNA